MGTVVCHFIMKYVIPIFLSISTFVQSYQRFDGDKVFRITDKNLDIHKLESVLGETVDIWTHKRGAVDVRISETKIPGFKTWAAEQGLTTQVYIENVQDLIDTKTIESKTTKTRKSANQIFDINDFNYTTYHTYDEIIEWTHEICKLHSDICRLI